MSMETKFCISCGEEVGKISRYTNPDVADAMRVRCQECAEEVLGMSLPKVGTLQHGTGGGRRVIRETKTH